MYVRVHLYMFLLAAVGYGHSRLLEALTKRQSSPPPKKTLPRFEGSELRVVLGRLRD